MEFQHKVVIITGASAGIGAECALHFAKRSADLSLVGRNGNNLETVAKQCEEISGKKPLTIVADLTVEENIQRVVNETINVYRKIDVLVNNAGVVKMSGVLGDIADFDWMMATNVRGTYLLTQLVIPYLIETKGNIVNVSSIASTVPIPIMTFYCMSKAAVDMLTKCVALEFAPKGIRVNSVNPGPVRTNIFAKGGMSQDENDIVFNELKKKMPLQRLANCEEVAKIVCFLASDDAKCVTGSSYEIDCGLHLGTPTIPS